MSENFRAIDASALTPPAAPPAVGAAPMLQWVAIERLVVDESYQRPIERRGAANVARIAREFRWCRFSPVIASPVAGGKLAIVDGQHRTTAAALLGFAEVPCQIIIADTREQADAFRAINGAVTQVSSLALFHSAIVAGDADALDVARIAAEAGVRILRSNRSSASMAIGDCACPATLMTIYRDQGPRVLQRALQAITLTPNNIPGNLGATLLTALALALASRQPLLNYRERLIAVMTGVELEQELEAFRIERRGGDKFGSLAKAFAGRLGDLIDAHGARFSLTLP